MNFHAQSRSQIMEVTMSDVASADRAEFTGRLSVETEAPSKFGRAPTAYIAGDGTEMIATELHCTVNRCAYERRTHVWQRKGSGFACARCQRFVYGTRPPTSN